MNEFKTTEKEKVFEDLLKALKPFLGTLKRLDYGDKLLIFDYSGQEFEIKLKEKPKKYKCKLCGRSGFTKKSPHNCVGGSRKRNFEWEELK